MELKEEKECQTIGQQKLLTEFWTFLLWPCRCFSIRPFVNFPGHAAPVHVNKLRSSSWRFEWTHDSVNRNSPNMLTRREVKEGRHATNYWHSTGTTTTYSFEVREKNGNRTWTDVHVEITFDVNDEEVLPVDMFFTTCSFLHDSDFIVRWSLEFARV